MVFIVRVSYNILSKKLDYDHHETIKFRIRYQFTLEQFRLTLFTRNFFICFTHIEFIYLWNWDHFVSNIPSQV